MSDGPTGASSAQGTVCSTRMALSASPCPSSGSQTSLASARSSPPVAALKIPRSFRQSRQATIFWVDTGKRTPLTVASPWRLKFRVKGAGIWSLLAPPLEHQLPFGKMKPECDPYSWLLKQQACPHPNALRTTLYDDRQISQRALPRLLRTTLSPLPGGREHGLLRHRLTLR